MELWWSQESDDQSNPVKVKSVGHSRSLAVCWVRNKELYLGRTNGRLVVVLLVLFVVLKYLVVVLVAIG